MGKRKYYYTRSQQRFTHDGLTLVRILIQQFRDTYLAYYLSNYISKEIRQLPKQRYYKPMYRGSLPFARTASGGSLFCDPLFSQTLYELSPGWVLQRGTGVLTPQGRMAIPTGG